MKVQGTVIEPVDPVESLPRAESKSETKPTGTSAGSLSVKYFISQKIQKDAKFLDVNNKLTLIAPRNFIFVE